MKILHLLQRPQLRGAEVFASQLAAHTINQGHEAILVFVYGGDMEKFPFSGTKYTLNGKGGLRRFADIAAWKKLQTIIREEQPDIIQANAGDTLKYAVLSKKICGWKQPIVFRNASTLSLYIKSKSAHLLNGFFFKHASKIISVSNTSAEDFARLYPEYKNMIETIPIGIEDSVNMKPAIAASEKTGPLLVHVGGFTFEKNHRGVIEIFEKFLEKHPTANLHLVGDGPLKKEIEQFVAAKNLTRSIVFHGFKKNPLDYIISADLLLLPSIIEGLPGVILEAFYCKIPVVAYDTGGIKEIVINQKTGRLIPKGQIAEFATAIEESLLHSPANDQMIQNAYDLTLRKYSNSNITKEFIHLYQSVVAEPAFTN